MELLLGLPEVLELQRSMSGHEVGHSCVGQVVDVSGGVRWHAGYLAQVNSHQHVALVRAWWMSVELGVRGTSREELPPCPNRSGDRSGVLYVPMVSR